MRGVLSFALILLALASAAMIAAQSDGVPDQKLTGAKGKPKLEMTEKAPGAGTVRATLAQLQLEIKTKPLRDALSLKEFLDLITGELASNGRDVTILVDKAAFRDEEGADAQDPYDAIVRVLTSRDRASVLSLLRQAVNQLPLKSAILVRGDRVEIVPLARFRRRSSRPFWCAATASRSCRWHEPRKNTC